MIRLQHLNTGRFLHSHLFTSPLSGNQEVSAFGDLSGGDTGTISRIVSSTDISIMIMYSSIELFIHLLSFDPSIR